MIELLIAFLVGMIVMDVMWAFKLGIPQSMLFLYRVRKWAKENRKEHNDYC
jgi:hypothetical protein